MKKIKKLIVKLLLIALCLVLGGVIVYFYNLDLKLAAALKPVLEKCKGQAQAKPAPEG